MIFTQSFALSFAKQKRVECIKHTAICRTISVAVLLCGIFLSAPLFAQTQTSKQSGRWTDPTTWVSGRVPAASDQIIIASGHTVTYDNTAPNKVASITLNRRATLTLEKDIEVTDKLWLRDATLNLGDHTLRAGTLTLGFITESGIVNREPNSKILVTSWQHYNSAITLNSNDRIQDLYILNSKGFKTASRLNLTGSVAVERGGSGPVTSTLKLGANLDLSGDLSMRESTLIDNGYNVTVGRQLTNGDRSLKNWNAMTMMRKGGTLTAGNMVFGRAVTTVSFRGGDRVLDSFITKKYYGSFPNPDITQDPKCNRTSGLTIENLANDAFVLGRISATDQSEMTLNWDAAPVVIGCDWTLRWKGDHVATLREYHTKGQLKIGTLPTGQLFDTNRDIFYDQDKDFASEAYTYVGFAKKANFSKMIPFVGDETYGGVSQINVYGSAIMSTSQPFQILFDTGSWPTLIPYSNLDKSQITFVGSFKLTEASINALQLPEPTKTSLKTMKDQVFESQAGFEQRVQQVGVTLTQGNKLPILEAAYQKVEQPWDSDRRCYKVRGQLAFRSKDGTTTYSVDDYEFYGVLPGGKIIMGAFPSPQPWGGIKSLPYALAEKYPTAGRVGFGIITSSIDKSYLMVEEDPNIDFTNLNWRIDIPLWRDPAKIPFAPEATPGFNITMNFPENDANSKQIKSESLMATIDTGAPELVLRSSTGNRQNTPAFSDDFTTEGYWKSWWRDGKMLRNKDDAYVMVEFTDSKNKSFCYTFVPSEDAARRDRVVVVGPSDGVVPWPIGLPDKPQNRFNLGNTLYRNCPVFFYDITTRRVGFSFE